MKGRQVHPHLTAEAVLAWMETDRLYRTPEIAQVFGVPRQRISDLFRNMKRKGDIEKTLNEDNSWSWSTARRKPAPLNTSIAGPQLGPDLTRTIQGYDAEMRRRIELAMSTRRAA